ncbi:MAG: iron ABC transporter permease [Clostridia bacterium]|jgi:iron complex transport system permease protein|nr:iron ABC transporter permease [Clostridia bacterium]MBT7123109.1 iron ABC transporter permease [Clostridia bacterium]
MRKLHHISQKNTKYLVLGLAMTSVLLIVLSLGFGYYRMNIADVFHVITGASGDPNGWIVLGIRFPRIIAAYIIGAALSVSGATYQGVLKNPLVSPDILGVASGAGMGAALAIMLGLNNLMIQIFAFGAGLVAVLATYIFAKHVKFDRRVSLILSGVLVGSLAFSITTMMKYLADTTDQLPEITYWLMGSLSRVSTNSLLVSLPFMAVGFALLFVMRWRINVLTLDDIESKSLGVNTKRDMRIVIVGATLACSAAVGLGGLIGWVGLMIPHITRAITGPQYTRLLPVSAMIGGIFLLLMDDIVRSLFVMEIPIGLAVAFIGAPFFYMLIRRRRKC